VAQSINRLLKTAGPEILASPTLGDGSSRFLDPLGHLGRDLASLLGERNGFYAFESALLVRPFNSVQSPLGMLQWNAATLWKDSYEQVFDGIVFFAEDLFGGQFCIREGAVWLLDPEQGEYERIAENLEGWAAEILGNAEVRTGYPLAMEWRKRQGPLREGFRLLPKLPFFVGGKFEIENLYAVEDVTGMRYRGSVAKQVRSIPDGGPLRFKVGKEPPPADSN
jgi:hypothetical protein